MKSNEKFTQFGLLISMQFGLLLSFGTEWIFKACSHEDGSIGKCNNSQHIIFILGIIIMALSVIAYVSRKKPMLFIAELVVMLFSYGLCLFIPNCLIGVCKMEHMICRKLMLPAVNIFSIFGFAIILILLVTEVKKKAGDKK